MSNNLWPVLIKILFPVSTYLRSFGGNGTAVALAHLALAEFYLVTITDATEEQLHDPQATRLLRMRVQAVHAVLAMA